MAKLTKEKALDGLKVLHGITKNASKLTMPELKKACGLRLTDMIVLRENGIISCSGTKSPEWKWENPDIIPSIAMAEKMLYTKVKAWYNRGNKEPETTHPAAAAQASTKPKPHSGIRVFKKYEITKQYGNEKFVFTIVDTGRGWDFDCTGKEVIFDTVNVDKLKAVGFALITAAELMEKKEE